jgi:hypothetical protein
MEILSSRAPEPQDKLSIAEIQSNIPYLIKLHPATKFKAIQNEVLVSYRKNDEIHFLKMNHEESQWIHYFQMPRSLEDLSQLVESDKASEEELMTLVFDWIQKEIIYCSFVTRSLASTRGLS